MIAGTKLTLMSNAAHSDHGVGVRAYPESVAIDTRAKTETWRMRIDCVNSHAISVLVPFESLILPEGFSFLPYKVGDTVWCLSTRLTIHERRVSKIRPDLVKMYDTTEWKYHQVFPTIDEALAALKEQLLAK